MPRRIERERKDPGRIGITVRAEFRDWLEKKAFTTGQSRNKVVEDLISSAMGIEPDPDPFHQKPRGAVDLDQVFA